MRTEPFVVAMRAELEAIVSRYEALVGAHQEALDAIAKQQALALQARLDVAERERAELVSRLHQRDADVARLESRATEFERSIAQARASIEQERASAREVSSAAITSAEQSERQVRELEARLAEVAGLAKMLDEVFGAERQFVTSALRSKGHPLFDAVVAALGADVQATPETFGQLKAKRPDVVLTHVIQSRGSRVAQMPLSDDERASLQGMSEAAGCELIVPDAGTRYTSSSMDKTATLREPSEEGNVLDCMMPGLRLAGTAGAFVFPKVKVAVG